MSQVLPPPPTRGVEATPGQGVFRAGTLLVAAVGIGIALRLAAAQGPFGLDEAWSLHLAGSLPSIGDAFWGLPHDNNHALNTAVLVALGPDRPPWVYRIPALVFGTLTILAMAHGLARVSMAAAMAGAMVAAVTLPLVDFGSEARGYAGLVLASVLAIGWWRVALAHAAPSGAARRARWGLAAAAGFGAFNHLAMGISVGVLVAATLILVLSRLRRAGPVLAVTCRLFAPTAIAMLPAAFTLALAIHRGGGFRVGDVDPFTPAKLARGLGDMTALTLGLPATALSPLFAAVVLACLFAAARRDLLDPATRALCAAAFVVLPAALWAVGMPNVGYARYFAICAVVLVLALSEAAGQLWLRGGKPATCAAAGLGIVLLASLTADLQAIRTGRSPGPATRAILAARDNATVGTSHPAMTGLLLGDASPATAAARSDGPGCELAPAWYIAVGVYDGRPGGTITPGREECRQTYHTPLPFASNPLSGTQWTLYRRDP